MTTFTIDDREYVHEGELAPVSKSSEGVYLVKPADGRTIEVFRNSDGRLSDGSAIDGVEVKVKTERERIIAERFAGTSLTKAGAGKHTAKAPMPGLVKTIIAQVGDGVTKATPVLILEAMKMENIITAGADGILKEVKAETGRNVEKGAALFTVE